MHQMRKYIFLIPTCLSFALFASCTCAYLDCLSDNYSFQFDIVRASDSADLVFGRHRVYDKSEFRFYSLKGTDTTFYKLNSHGYYLNPPEDSALSVWFYPATDTAYMRFNNTDIDTLVMSFDTRKTKCCGTITEITDFRINDKVVPRGREGALVIK